MGLRFGIAVGSLLMVVVGWIPIIGPVLAGITAGIVTRSGMRKGVVAGFLSGLIGILILIGMAFWLKSFISSFIEITPLESISKFPQSLICITIFVILLETPIFGLIGGLIGGTLSNIDSSIQKPSKELSEKDSAIIQKLLAEKDEISKLLNNLKESLEAGKISQKTYEELKRNFEKKLNIIDKKLEKVKKE
ncbi:MAG: DUF5518 domain-containing protein [Archaeoglobaceae archaeon]